MRVRVTLCKGPHDPYTLSEYQKENPVLLSYEASRLPLRGDIFRILTEDIDDDASPRHPGFKEMDILRSIQYKAPVVKLYTVVDIIHSAKVTESSETYMHRVTKPRDYDYGPGKWHPREPRIEEQAVEIVVREA